MISLSASPPVLQDAFDAVTEGQVEGAARRLRMSFPKVYVEFLCAQNGGRFAQMAVAGPRGTHIQTFYSIAATYQDLDLENRIIANRNESGERFFTIGDNQIGQLLLIQNSNSNETVVVVLDYATHKKETVAESLREFLETVAYSPHQEKLWTETEAPFTFIERGAVSSVADYKDILSMKNSLGQSPLACAASSLQPRVVECLLEMGASLDEVDANGMSPLMLAAENGGVEICETLLKRGANTTLRNSRGMSALDIAIEDDVWRVKELLIAVKN